MNQELQTAAPGIEMAKGIRKGNRKMQLLREESGNAAGATPNLYNFAQYM